MATPRARFSSPGWLAWFPSTAVSISSSFAAPLETSSLCWKTQTTYGCTLGRRPLPSSTTISSCPFCRATTTSCVESEADLLALAVDAAASSPLLLSCDPDRGVRGGVFWSRRSASSVSFGSSGVVSSVEREAVKEESADEGSAEGLEMCAETSGLVTMLESASDMVSRRSGIGGLGRGHVLCRAASSGSSCVGDRSVMLGVREFSLLAM